MLVASPALRARTTALLGALVAAFAVAPVLGAQATTSKATTAAAPRAASASPGYVKEFGTMWTFDAPPLDYWKSTYGFTPDQQWLDHVRLSAVRIPGCSASFVSKNGLVMTNHHCGRSCTAGVSPADTNYIETGFAAPTVNDERKCPGMWADQLQSIGDVTDRVRGAMKAGSVTERVAQRDAEIEKIQNECPQGLRCEVVSLYQGGRYSVYRYRRFTDLRLVMAPEEGIAFYGGDPDNFTYPRYDLDLTLLRVYENGQPYQPTDYLKWSAAGAAENELVFVVGNPGSTGRLNTMAQMEYLRDVQYPATLRAYDRLLTTYRALGPKDPAKERQYQNTIFSLANSQKAVRGYYVGLVDTTIQRRKRAFEQDFRARIARDPALRAKYGTAFTNIERAERELKSFATQYRYYNYAGGSQLLAIAGDIVRLPVQARLADSLRLPNYRGTALDKVHEGLLSQSIRIDPEFEQMVLTDYLRTAQQELPKGDPFLAKALGGRSPEDAARALVQGSRLGDLTVRRELVLGEEKAVAASDDPMIALARWIEPVNRRLAMRASRLNATISTNAEKIGEAIFAAYGTALPPDATFTLRITDGVVKGYPYNGTLAPYKTTFYGLYERSASFDDKPPFNLPARWQDPARRAKLNMATPYDFVSTNDIIGGNSGSPVINRNAEVVGLIFDGNIESLPNRFIFTDDVARSVSVHSQGIVEALRAMYEPRIADELMGK